MKPEDGVQSVILAIRLLEAVAESETPKRVTDLAQQIGTTKARVFRHLQTLVKRGYALQDEASGRYCSGPKLVLLGQRAIENLSLVNEARPVMRALCDALGHSVGLSQLAGESLHTVDMARGSTPFSITSLRGTQQIFHATALGKVALAFGEPRLAEKVLAAPLAAVTPHTITDPEKLRREIGRIAARGWAVSPNELNIGINALAAPIFDASERLTGAIAILDMVQLLPAQPSPKQIDSVLAAAVEISRRLGYRGTGTRTRIAKPRVKPGRGAAIATRRKAARIAVPA